MRVRAKFAAVQMVPPGLSIPKTKVMISSHGKGSIYEVSILVEMILLHMHTETCLQSFTRLAAVESKERYDGTCNGINTISYTGKDAISSQGKGSIFEVSKPVYTVLWTNSTST